MKILSIWSFVFAYSLGFSDIDEQLSIHGDSNPEFEWCVRVDRDSAQCVTFNEKNDESLSNSLDEGSDVRRWTIHQEGANRWQICTIFDTLWNENKNFFMAMNAKWLQSSKRTIKLHFSGKLIAAKPAFQDSSGVGHYSWLRSEWELMNHPESLCVLIERPDRRTQKPYLAGSLLIMAAVALLIYRRLRR